MFVCQKARRLATPAHRSSLNVGRSIGHASYRLTVLGEDAASGESIGTRASWIDDDGVTNANGDGDLSRHSVAAAAAAASDYDRRTCHVTAASEMR